AVQGLFDQPQQARNMADAGLAVMKANQGRCNACSTGSGC
ncbi:3-deoxy-D-manno-octulosonic-acid transferase, partial [Pseudomonas syringae pv. japonica str. M301072]